MEPHEDMPAALENMSDASTLAVSLISNDEVAGGGVEALKILACFRVGDPEGVTP